VTTVRVVTSVVVAVAVAAVADVGSVINLRHPQL